MWRLLSILARSLHRGTSRCRSCRVRVTVGACVAMPVIVAGVAIIATRPLSQARENPRFPPAGNDLLPSSTTSPAVSGVSAPASVDLGMIPAGGRADTRLLLFNDSGAWLEVSETRTSCPCLSVIFDEQRIAPNESEEATLFIDMSGEPEFIGGLSPYVEVFDDQGRLRFNYVVTAQVVEQPMLDFSSP